MPVSHSACHDDYEDENENVGDEDENAGFKTRSSRLEVAVLGLFNGVQATKFALLLFAGAFAVAVEPAAAVVVVGAGAVLVAPMLSEELD